MSLSKHLLLMEFKSFNWLCKQSTRSSFSLGVSLNISHIVLVMIEAPPSPYSLLHTSIASFRKFLVRVGVLLRSRNSLKEGIF